MERNFLISFKGLFRCQRFFRSHCHPFFLDTGAFTASFTLEIKLGTTNTAYFMQFYRLDVGREKREIPFYAYAIGDLTNRERSRMAYALALDNIPFETLDTLLV